MYDDLKGKVSLITGSGNKKGIGGAIAMGLAREGVNIIVTDINKPPDKFDEWDRAEGWKGVESLAADAKKLGVKAVAIHADLTNRKDLSDMVEKALKAFGKIDILVNNAGIISKDTGMPNVVDFPEEIWDRSMAVNLTAPFLISKLVAPQMIKRGEGGRIINMLSQAAKRGGKGRADYSSTKFGFNGLTQVLANELGPYKITVNGICPGLVASYGSMGKPIWVAMTKGKMTEDDAIDIAYGIRFGVKDLPRASEALEKEIWDVCPNKTSLGQQMNPLNRVGRVREIASMALFLASKEADFITGQAINVGGGAVFH